MPSPDRYPASAVPWPSVLEWSREELAGYLAAAGDPLIQALPTRCHPWTVHHLTAHLAATFTRFGAQLDRARRGDLDLPFPRGQLSAVNLRAVSEFQGDPVDELDRRARLFLDAARTPGELMGHQLGPIPIGLQVMFGLNELAVHHDDLARAAGSSYQPTEENAIALAGMYDSVFGLPAGEDLGHASSRRPDAEARPHAVGCWCTKSAGINRHGARNERVRRRRSSDPRRPRVMRRRP